MTYTLSPFNDRLWIGQSRSFAANCGIWTSDSQACLVDPGVHPDEIDALAAFCQHRGVRPQVIAITHYHWDHILGPARFPGVPVVGHINAEVEKRRRGEVVSGFITRGGFAPADPPFTFPLPDCAVQGEQAIQIAGLVLWAIPVPGHASDALSLYEPESGTLWAGDMLSDIEGPLVMDSLLDYESSLRRIGELSISALVPGHGSPTRDEEEIERRLERDLAYVAGIRKLVTSALESGLSLGDTVAAGMHLAQGILLSADDHQANIEQAYVEQGGAALGEVGWERLRKHLADEA